MRYTNRYINRYTKRYTNRYTKRYTMRYTKRYTMRYTNYIFYWNLVNLLSQTYKFPVFSQNRKKWKIFRFFEKNFFIQNDPIHVISE